MKLMHVMPELVINKQETISGIQKQFNNFFPFLKIEFFRQAPIAGIGNTKNKMITIDIKIGELLGKNKSGHMNFSDQTKVADLEKIFEKDFGLFIQVFRKSGKVWL